MENSNTHYYDSNGCGTAIDSGINSGLVYYDCPYRLPCGYCRFLMRDCVKKSTPSYTTTYTSSKDNNK